MADALPVKKWRKLLDRVYSIRQVILHLFRIALGSQTKAEVSLRMYGISKDPDGVILICHNCSHVEHVDAFDKSVGSRRTQAARAMQTHSRDEHGAGSVLNPVPEGKPRSNGRRTTATARQRRRT